MNFGGGVLGGHLEDIWRTFVGLLEDIWIFGGHLLKFGGSGPANVFGASPKIWRTFTSIFPYVNASYKQGGKTTKWTIGDIGLKQLKSN